MISLGADLILLTSEFNDRFVMMLYGIVNESGLEGVILKFCLVLQLN